MSWIAKLIAFFESGKTINNKITMTRKSYIVIHFDGFWAKGEDIKTVITHLKSMGAKMTRPAVLQSFSCDKREIDFDGFYVNYPQNTLLDKMCFKSLSGLSL